MLQNYLILVGMSERLKKIIRKLDQKKYRRSLGLIKIEGRKLIEEAISSGFEIDFLLSNEVSSKGFDESLVTIVDDTVLSQLTSFKNHQGIIAAVRFDNVQVEQKSSTVLVLDGVSDPGNLGTIVRLAEWFGINQIIGLPPFVDPMNPKTIQSSMGSIFRVQVTEMSKDNLRAYFESLNHPPIFVADMQGEDFRECSFKEKEVVLVMGSESHGPSGFWNEIQNVHRITIPKAIGSKTESLNVAMATGIILERTLG